jgi:hypothetical protein
VGDPSLEALIAREDERLSALHRGPPEDYDGWWLEDIVAPELRGSFLCALMNVVARLLEEHCECVAACLQMLTLKPFSEHVKDARKFLEEAKCVNSADSRWILQFSAKTEALQSPKRSRSGPIRK